MEEYGRKMMRTVLVIWPCCPALNLSISTQHCVDRMRSKPMRVLVDAREKSLLPLDFARLLFTDVDGVAQRACSSVK